MNESKSKAKGVWNHSTPVIFSPLFDWPPNPKGAFLALAKRWVTISRNVVFLLLAVMVFRYLVPEYNEMQSLSVGWIGSVFLRNYLIMCAIAGGLHLYLYTFRAQGRRLKYDPRAQHEKSKKFSFKNQVWDNVFWSLASGATVWSLYEVAYFWGVANGYIPTLSFDENLLAFGIWLLVLPILASSHFYFIHRLLHIPFLYRSVHRLHHRNIHTGPWSGMSMHPIEHVIYLSSVLVHFIIPSHPVILLVHLYSRCLGPAFSHAGFEKLLVRDKELIDAADFHHQLHHRYFECNYGTVDAPWDRWFGTCHYGSEADTIRIRKRRTLS